MARSHLDSRWLEMTRVKAAARPHALLSLLLHLLLLLSAVAASNSSASASSSVRVRVELSWQKTTLLDVALAERSMREGAREFFASVNNSKVAVDSAAVSSVRAVDGVEANLTLRLDAFNASESDAQLSTFRVVVSLGLTLDNATMSDFNATLGNWNASQAQIFQAIANRLQNDVTAAISTSTNGDGLNSSLAVNSSDVSANSSATDSNAPLLRMLSRFTADNVNVSVSLAPTTGTTTTTTNSTADTLTLTLTLRNIVDPLELPRSVIWQARVGLLRFLAPVLNITNATTSTSNLSVAVETLGDPQVAASSVLLVTQRLSLRLPPPVIASTLVRLSRYEEDMLLSTTRVLNISKAADRRALANMIMFGDPTRPVTTASTSRPSMFLDYMTMLNSLNAALASDAIAQAPTFLRALFPFVFASIAVEDPRLASIDAAEATAQLTSSNTTITAVSNDELRARRIQKFRFDPNGYYAALPSNVSYPPDDSNNTSIATTAATMNSTCTFAFCTSIYWTNSVGRGFWLQRVDSSNTFAWDLFPTQELCSSSTSYSSLEPDPTANADEETQLAALAQLLPAPLIEPQPSKTPVWTLGALSGLRKSKLDLALHLISEDGATKLKIEVATDIQSPLDASATVTSIARLTNSSSAGSIYQSSSNLVVNAHSRFRYVDTNSPTATNADGREIVLFLEIRESQVTQKDTTQPCAHCQSLYEWCANDVKCAALRDCITSGAQLASVGQTLLSNLTLSAGTRSTNIWSTFAQCLQPALNASSSRDAALLFASAVRCQMQRLCPFQVVAAPYNTTGNDDSTSDERILLWESEAARQRITLTTPASNSSIAATASSMPSANISIQLGNQTLCFLALMPNVTGEWFEDAVARECRYAKYLGRILTSMTSDTNTNTSTTTITLDVGFKYLVGPAPTLQVVNATANAAADIQVLRSPEIFLRVETKAFVSGGNLLPPPPPNVAQTPTKCDTCSQLALDVCLRDTACTAFTDCITRYAIATTGGATTLTGDALFAMFQRSQSGDSLSLLNAINSCHSSDMVTHPSWLKLVRASGCFSRAQCPISLNVLLPSSTTVGLWQLSPDLKRQNLYYYFDSTTTVASSPLRIPLQLVADGQVIKSTSSGLDPLTLQANLRRLLAFEDIYVSLLSGTADGSDANSARIWEIAYGNWIGALPQVVAAKLSPTWILATITAGDSGQEDAVVRLVAASSTTTTEVAVSA